MFANSDLRVEDTLPQRYKTSSSHPMVSWLEIWRIFENTVFRRLHLYNWRRRPIWKETKMQILSRKSHSWTYICCPISFTSWLITSPNVSSGFKTCLGSWNLHGTLIRWLAVCRSTCKYWSYEKPKIIKKKMRWITFKQASVTTSLLSLWTQT